VFALLTTELADPEHPILLDGFLRLGPWKGFSLFVGQMRSPLFYSARSELEGTQPLPELSLPVRALWPRRDAGLELHHALRESPLEAWARLSNGSPSPFENDNASLAFTARVDATAGRARRGATGAERFGLAIGAGVLIDDSFDRAGAPGITLGDFTFYRPPTVTGLRRIVEGHALALVGPLRFLVEIGSAIEERAADTDGNPSTARVALDPVRTRGVSVEAEWMLTGRRRRAGTWPGPTRLGLGVPEIEVAARVDRVDLGRGARDVKPGGALGVTLGVNAWLNALASVSLAGAYYRYDVGPIEEPDVLSSWIVMTRVTVLLNPPPTSVGAAPLLSVR
jgi:phosphate-selective porin OprO/OprP